MEHGLMVKRYRCKWSFLSSPLLYHGTVPAPLHGGAIVLPLPGTADDLLCPGVQGEGLALVLPSPGGGDPAVNQGQGHPGDEEEPAPAPMVPGDLFGGTGSVILWHSLFLIPLYCIVYAHELHFAIPSVRQ